MVEHAWSTMAHDLKTVSAYRLSNPPPTLSPQVRPSSPSTSHVKTRSVGLMWSIGAPGPLGHNADLGRRTVSGKLPSSLVV